MFKTPKGTRDLDPSLARKYQYVLDVVREVFERYGFNPLFTPVFEDFKLLSAKSGESIKDEIYYFQDKSKRELGLRFEFTASLARFISNNPTMPKPFKRYQYGKVWRYDQPQAMRFREFWQADVDIIGSTSIEADAEVLSCFAECMDSLGFKDYYIRVNSRKIIEEKMKKVGIKNIKDVFRTIDKMDKIGIDGVKKELKTKKIDDVKVMKVIKDFNKPEGEIKELLDIAKKLGFDKKLKFDSSLVRGLAYYTGLVYEVYVGKGLACGGGGRYDDLIKQLGGPDLPATGISFGIDRLVNLMDEKQFPSVNKSYFVVNVNDKVKPEVYKIVKKLRAKGISCDYDLMNRKLGKQLGSASDYPYVLIIGEKELAKKSVTLRDMKTGKEKLVKIDKLSKI